nr:ribonuclease H-like domain-containing protein [Tanacetum cinerariifolium]
MSGSCFNFAQDTINTNELLSKLLQQLGNIGLSANTNSSSPSLTYQQGVRLLFIVVHLLSLAHQLAFVIPLAFNRRPKAQIGIIMGPFLYNQPNSMLHLPLWPNNKFSAHPSQQFGNMGPTPLSGHATTLLHAFNTETLQDATTGAGNMDTGASSHLNNSINSLSIVFNTCMYPSISVGDSHSIPVINTDHSILSTPLKSLHLNNVLITPHIVKKLIYVRQFGRDNNCPIKFNAFGFSVKDFMTRQHLGHPGCEVLRHLVSNNFISCNKEKPFVLWHVCQLGKHVRLPFYDHGGEFDNPNLHKLFADNGIQFCFPGPKTNQQNDGTLCCYKARPVANCSIQLEGVDVDETFSPVVKLSTILTAFSLAASRQWPIHQLDIKNAFLHGLFLSKNKYPIELLDMAHMDNCDPSRTPIDTESKMGSDGDLVSNPTLYRSLARSLQYFTFTRPDISYAVEQHQRTKYIEIDIHFVSDLVAAGQVRVLHVPSRYQFADIFIKGLSSALFEEFRSSLSVRFPLAPTAEE